MSTIQHILGLWCLAALSACSSATPVTKSGIERYTGIKLCPGATVHDLTTVEERDTTPGFSYHVTLDVPLSCAASFERQLAALSHNECTPERLRRTGCFMQDVYPAVEKRSSMMIGPLRANRFDLRFYE